MKIISILVSILLINIGCASLKFWNSDSSTEPSEKQKQSEKESLDLFNNGNKLLDEKKYSEAIQSYSKILSKEPSSTMETMTVFNMGVAYEALGKCKRAGQSFRKVVRTNSGEKTRLQAQALYHLSKAYECVGADVKVISTLIDLQSRLEFLTEEVAYAELPARLASAYARQGNLELAEKYFKLAEKGLARVSSLKIDSKEKSEILAKTLFLMGSVSESPGNFKNVTDIIKSLEFSQRYLLKAVEMDHEQWSPRSAESILRVYDKIIARIEPKRNSTETEEETQKLDLAKAALTNLELLKRNRFPESINQKVVQVLFEQLHKKELVFQNYI